MMTEMLHLYKFTIWAIPAETTGYYYQKMKLVLGIIILFLQIIFFYMIMDTYKNYFNLP